MKKSVLITGATGFVGPYLKQELLANNYQVITSDLNGKSDYTFDLTNKEKTFNTISKIMPDFIVHLAGFSSVKRSFEMPDLCHKINVEGTKNLLEAVRKVSPNTKLLIISSSEVYGRQSKFPISENANLDPTNPYADSRVKQESLLKKFTDLKWIISRSYTHIGSGQPLDYVSSDFASQIAKINIKHTTPEISVGNLDAIRDFSDVKDVVRAYRLLLEKGDLHEIYNVCSGIGTEISELLNGLLSFSKIPIKVISDAKNFRPSDNPCVIGDNEKIRIDTGWTPKIPLKTTLKNIYNSWIEYYSHEK